MEKIIYYSPPFFNFFCNQIFFALKCNIFYQVIADVLSYIILIDMAYSEDITRYLRCNRVIGQVLTPIVREYMQLTNVPPATVFQTIMQPYCERFRKRLSQKEMRIIQTLSSDHYKNFDITLMYKLARDKHFKMIILDYPTRKWGADPQHNEISIGDDIERIRLSRDHIMHSPTHLMSEREFNNFFDKFVDVAKRADAHINIAAFLSYEQQLEDLRRCHIDPKTTMKLYETLEENKNLKGKYMQPSFHNLLGILVSQCSPAS